MHDDNKVELRQLCQLKYGKSPNNVRGNDGTFPIIGSSGISGLATHALFEGPAIVLGRKGTLDNPIYVDEPFWPIDTTYAALPESEVHAKWLYYQLCNFDLKSLNAATGVPSISRSQLERILIVNAPHEDQKAIVLIIESIDGAISATEALLAKQRKIKEGLLHDLLTRGIDENGQLRPSPTNNPEAYKNTELGLIPKAWKKQKKISDLAPLVTSGSRGWARHYSNQGDLFIRIGNLTRDHINFRLDDVQHVDLGGETEGTRTKLQENDILISITADLGIVGVVPQWNVDAYINQHIALVRCDEERVQPRFLGHFLASHLGQKQFQFHNEAGAKAGLNLPTIRSIVCYLPEKEEQKSIVIALDNADRDISLTQGEIQKLSKMKTGLMQDLLSGKKRVTPKLIEMVEAMKTETDAKCAA